MELQHYKNIVSGKVHGVFYRASANEKANELVIKGFVSNEPNGDVYLEAEAEEDMVYKFIKWCNIGPARAKVYHMDAVPGEVMGYSSFDIKR